MNFNKKHYVVMTGHWEKDGSIVINKKNTRKIKCFTSMKSALKYAEKGVRLVMVAVPAQ